jgi:hypothetical protein
MKRPQKPAWLEKSVGQLGVLMVAERLIRAGYSVAVPMVDDGYDILAIQGSAFWRIQIKSTAAMNRAHHSNAVKIRRGLKQKKRYGLEHCDAIAAVNVQTGIVRCVPVAYMDGRTWLSFKEETGYSEFDALS